MEALIALFALGVAGVLIAMPIVALVALTRANRALHELEQLRNRMEAPGAARGCGASHGVGCGAGAVPKASRTGHGTAAAAAPEADGDRRGPEAGEGHRAAGRRAAPAGRRGGLRHEPRAEDPRRRRRPRGRRLPRLLRALRLGERLGRPHGARAQRRRLQPGSPRARPADHRARLPPAGPGPRRHRFRRPLHHGLRRARRLRPRAAKRGGGIHDRGHRVRRPRGRAPRRAPARGPRLGRRLPGAGAALDRRRPGGEPLRLPAPPRRGGALAGPAQALARNDADRPRRHPAAVRRLVRGPLPAGAIRGGGGRPRGARRALRGGHGTEEAAGLARGDAARGRPRPVAAVDRRRPAGGAARALARPRLRGAADRPRPRPGRRAGGGGGRGRALPRLGGHALPGGELRPRGGLGGRRRAAAGSRGTHRGPSRGPDARARRRGGRPRVGRPRRAHGPPGGAARARRRPGPPGRGHRETVGLDDPDRSLARHPGRSSAGTTATTGRSVARRPWRSA